MSVFEIISSEEFSAANSPDPLGLAENSAGEDDSPCRIGTPLPRTPLIWCDFCKGHYNEHHFGREVEEGGE